MAKKKVHPRLYGDFHFVPTQQSTSRNTKDGVQRISGFYESIKHTLSQTALTTPTQLQLKMLPFSKGAILAVNLYKYQSDT